MNRKLWAYDALCEFSHQSGVRSMCLVAMTSRMAGAWLPCMLLPGSVLWTMLLFPIWPVIGMSPTVIPFVIHFVVPLAYITVAFARLSTLSQQHRLRTESGL